MTITATILPKIAPQCERGVQSRRVKYPHYRNPLRGARRLVTARTDQGVDYFALPFSPIYPIGRARVTRATRSSGWPGGGAVQYVLLDGPHAGEEVYVAEWIRPTVKVDAIVGTETVIARFRFRLDQRFRGIETGFIRPGTHEPCNPDTSGRPTEGGVRFTRFMNALGCPTRDHFGIGPDSSPCGRWPDV